MNRNQMRNPEQRDFRGEYRNDDPRGGQHPQGQQDSPRMYDDRHRGHDHMHADRYDETRYDQTRGYGYGQRRDMHADHDRGFEQRERQQRVWDSAHHYHRGFDHGYEQGYRDAHAQRSGYNRGRASYDDDRYGFAGHGDYDRGPGGSESYDDRYGGSGHRGYNQNRYGEESTTYGWDRRR